MAIESTKLHNLADLMARSSGTRISTARVAANATPNVANNDAPVTDTTTAQQAATVIQDYLSGPVQPPKFNVDYLSGVNVMTVRSAESGEVVFQMPGPSALRLAQLIKEGVPASSSALVSESV